MKKHIIAIIIIICILSLVGVGIWLVVRNNNSKDLYEVSTQFIFSEDTDALSQDILKAQTLYTTKVSSSETRLNTLHKTITEINAFEKDLIAYLALIDNNNSKAREINKAYKSLEGTRTLLLDSYDQYITRMEGNIHADGTAVYDIYDDIFNKTVNYLKEYNSCFKQTANYVFDHLDNNGNLKSQIYTLYFSNVENLIKGISDYQFASTYAIDTLNDLISLDNYNIKINTKLEGGEFSTEAIKFKQYFNASNLTTLVNNFETLHKESATINPETETSNEKLAIYYLTQILEV